MSPRSRKFLLALYPSAWRRRHGDELDQLVADLAREPGFSRWGLIADLVRGAFVQRLTLPTTGGVALAVAVMVVGGAALALSSGVIAHQHKPPRITVQRNHKGRVTRISGAPVKAVVNPENDKIVSISRRHRRS